MSASLRAGALELAWPAAEAEELALLVAELTANAVKHGGGGRCVVALSSQSVELLVEDDGPGFSQAVLADAGRSWALGPDGPRPTREPFSSLGGGLGCARRFADLLELENRSEGGARVRASRRPRTTTNTEPR